MELCSCLFLTRLIHKVILLFDIRIEEILLWNNSTISLSWIRKSPHLLKSFISNRVAAIQDLTDSYQWQHVTLENNPADILSQGLDAKKLSNCNFWFYGSNFLQDRLQHIERYPVNLENNTEHKSEFKTDKNTNFSIRSENCFYNYLFFLLTIFWN